MSSSSKAGEFVNIGKCNFLFKLRFLTDYIK